MDQIINSLQKIGLSENESRVYVALTKLGDSTVKDISTEAGVKRPTTYLVLDELRQKNLITKIPHAKRAIYRAKDVDELYDFASENIREFKRSIPKLESISTTNKPVRALYFEGVQGLKDALFYKIDEQENKKITGFWAQDAGITQPIIDLFTKFNKALRKRNIHVTGVTPDGESQRNYKEEYPEFYEGIKFIPIEDYSSEISIDATDKFVRFIDAVEKKAVIIESERMAKTINEIFNLATEKYKD